MNEVNYRTPDIVSANSGACDILIDEYDIANDLRQSFNGKDEIDTASRLLDMVN
jgi:hypothetical protein